MTKRAQTGEQIRILVAFLGATVLTLACYISNDNLKHVVLIIGVLMTLVWDGWQLKGDLFLLPAIFSIGAVISLRTAYPFGVALCTVSWLLALAAKTQRAEVTHWTSINQALLSDVRNRQ